MTSAESSAQARIEELVQAAFNGDLDKVRTSLAAGVDVNAFGRVWNPLHAAIENMQVPAVRLLLEAGADPELRCYGGTALHHAIDIEIDSVTQAGGSPPASFELTELLLEAGADPMARDSTGQTPLQLALCREHSKAVTLLEKHVARQS